MVIGAEPLYGDVVHVSTLECAGEGCNTQLPLFAVWSADMPAEERRADISTWRWENLKCPQGHSRFPPLGWPH
jgi:hypothetical protein